MQFISIDTDSNEGFKRRFYIFAAVPILFFLVFISILFSLQIIRGTAYELKAKTNREQFSILPAIRGIIYDRTGKTVLAFNKRSFAVTLVPQNLPGDKNEREALLNNLALLMDMRREEILAIIGRKGYSRDGSYVVKTEVPFEDVVYIAEHNRNFPGVYWKSMPNRIYPYRDMLSHVIGYVGMISERELLNLSKRGYSYESVLGKNGVEKMYDMHLRGKDGYVRRIVDATNQVTSEIIDKDAEPTPGNNVILTVDAAVQKIAENALGEVPGAIVVSKPATGEVLAMASYPRYDANLFVSQKDKEAFKKLTLDQKKPFLNRAIQAQYPAGSIFKLVVAIALLDTGKVPPTKEFSCGGGYQLGNRFFSCWSSHGRVDLYKAIVNSCDSYFYQVSLTLGPEVIAEYARKLGLGKKLDIDIIGELEGFIPDPAWKRESRAEIWYEGDTLNLAIGQGYLLVTPLQLNALTNVIANRGLLFKPYVVSEIRSAKNDEVFYTRKPELLLDSGIDRAHFEYVLGAMRGVVTQGTAKWGGAVLSTEVAGKTSSAETSSQETHSWYTAMAPYNAEDPSQMVSVTAIVEFGGAGSANAAPIVSQVIEAIFSKSDLETARKNIWRKRSEAAKKKEQAESLSAE
jgi:penicillin-binding protein 2